MLQAQLPERLRCRYVSFPRKLLLGVEPRTSSLPRTRSTTELQQQVRYSQLAGEENRTPIACLEGRCSAIELHPRPDSAAAESMLTSHLFNIYGFSIWAAQDSNLRRTKSARFTVWCHWPLGQLPITSPGGIPGNGSISTTWNAFAVPIPGSCVLDFASVGGCRTGSPRSYRWELNPQPLVYKTRALPLSYGSKAIRVESVSIGAWHRCCKSKFPASQYLPHVLQKEENPHLLPHEAPI